MSPLVRPGLQGQRLPHRQGDGENRRGHGPEEIAIANTNASFEPRLDYVVAKPPRFALIPASATNKLGTQMKATGEVMGIGFNLEECLLKSVRSLEIGVCHFQMAKFDTMDNAQMLDYLQDFHDDGIFAVAQLLRNGVGVQTIHEVTAITPLFWNPSRKSTDMEVRLQAKPGDFEL